MDLSLDVVLWCLVIVAARIADVSIGILRIVFVVRGKRLQAACLGFLETLIWVFAIAAVTQHLDKPIYMFAFALGFAIGNYVGLTIEQRLAYGDQVIRIFTRLSTEMSSALRQKDYKVTTFSGQGKAGPIDMLLLKVKRKHVTPVLGLVKSVDHESFYFVDDITLTSDIVAGNVFTPGLFRLKRK